MASRYGSADRHRSRGLQAQILHTGGPTSTPDPTPATPALEGRADPREGRVRALRRARERRRWPSLRPGKILAAMRFWDPWRVRGEPWPGWACGGSRGKRTRCQGHPCNEDRSRMWARGEGKQDPGGHEKCAACSPRSTDPPQDHRGSWGRNGVSLSRSDGLDRSVQQARRLEWEHRCSGIPGSQDPAGFLAAFATITYGSPDAFMTGKREAGGCTPPDIRGSLP
jgi:hypothetical protein